LLACLFQELHRNLLHYDDIFLLGAEAVPDYTVARLFMHLLRLLFLMLGARILSIFTDRAAEVSSQDDLCMAIIVRISGLQIKCKECDTKCFKTSR
jgi:hypothetical protein